MNIIQSYLVNNDCYKANRKIVVKGLMLHSTGCNQPKASVFMKNWNKSGVEKCVHGFIEANGNIYQTLPWNHRGWHGGGSSNNTHIGVEICEDGLNDAAYFNNCYNTAVELFAYLCKEFNLNPLTQIIAHCEGYKKGIASNHADVMHWFPRYNKSMDTFRQDVKKLIETPNTPAVSAKTYIVKKGDSLAKIASMFGTTYQELARINNITNPSLIYAGQVIKLIAEEQRITPIVEPILMPVEQPKEEHEEVIEEKPSVEQDKPNGTNKVDVLSLIKEILENILKLIKGGR